jgi:hypothetical protein
MDMQINTAYGGRMVYWNEPEGHQASPKHYAMYFSCQTTLVETFRTHFSEPFTFEGNRAILFEEKDVVPAEAPKVCIAASLTSHRGKRSKMTAARAKT